VTSSAETIPLGQLPASISSYLVAHQARDLDTAVGYYTEDAITVDEGHTYRGPQQIRDWLAERLTHQLNQHEQGVLAEAVALLQRIVDLTPGTPPDDPP